MSNEQKCRYALLAVGCVLFAYGAWYLPRHLMILAIGSLIVFLAK